MEKHSICKCSNTPEARNFTSKGQAHVHCPCEKCEDKAVYPIVAWRHMRKRARYSDDNGDGADLDYADHHVHVATSLQPETIATLVTAFTAFRTIMQNSVLAPRL